MNKKIGKTTDGLMRHIRNKHGVKISGSRHKTDLINMGYYHSYKAYRFTSPGYNELMIDDFDEIKRIYSLDNFLKSLFYPQLMKIETALNNHFIACIVSYNDPSIYSIIDSRLTYADDLKRVYESSGRQGDRKTWERQNKRFLKLKSSVDRKIAAEYNYNDIIRHYIHENEPVPIWAYFEVTTLGDLGAFIENLSVSDKRRLCENIGFDLHGGYNPILLVKSIYLLKDLRNAVAHNKPVFDCRFLTGGIPQSLCVYFSDKFNIDGYDFTFNSITDYVALVYHFMSILQFTKTECNSLIRDYRKYVFSLQNSEFKESIFNEIFRDNDIEKIDLLR